jgi:hypothetical protein
MRLALGGVLLTLLLSACGGGDSNEPEDPFPDVAGVYEVDGTFDDLPATTASFQGTLELTQESRETSALGGSISVLAVIGDDIFNVSDEAISSATVSPSGVISFTAGDGLTTWTFSGTASGTSITNGRHTLSAGTDNLSGSWSGNSASSVVTSARISANSPDALWRRLRDR